VGFGRKDDIETPLGALHFIKQIFTSCDKQTLNIDNNCCTL